MIGLLLVDFKSSIHLERIDPDIVHVFFGYSQKLRAR